MNFQRETVVSGLPHNRSIEKVTFGGYDARYMVRQGKFYIGKVKDGGYRSKAAALRLANS